MEDFFAEEEKDDFHYEGGEAGGDELEDFGGDFFGAFSLAVEDPFAVREVGDRNGGNPGKDGGGVIFEVEDIVAEVVNDEISNSGDDTPENIGDDVEVWLDIFFVQWFHCPNYNIFG